MAAPAFTPPRQRPDDQGASFLIRLSAERRDSLHEQARLRGFKSTATYLLALADADADG